MKIYTRTGDKGTTALLGGSRCPKADPIFSALGTIDELSSHIGLVRAHTPSGALEGQLREVQGDLQQINSHLAAPATSKQRYPLPKEDKLETWIDEMTGGLPVLRNFILPVRPHFRHIRAEVSLVPNCMLRGRFVGGPNEKHMHWLIRKAMLNDQLLVISIGKPSRVHDCSLSDYLFTAARWVCHRDGIEETVYSFKSSNQ